MVNSSQHQVSQLNAQQKLELAKFHYRTVQTLIQQEEWQEAITQLQQAIELAPNLLEAHWQLGNICLKLERWYDAVTSYRNAIKLQSDNSQLYHSLGDALLHLEKWEEAIQAYQQAIQLNPKFSWSYNNIGDAFLKLQNWEKATQAYQKAIQLNSDFHWSYYNLGEAYSQLYQWDEAIAAYRQALQKQPDLLMAYEKLGNALQQQSVVYKKEAVKAYQTAIQYEPDNLELYHKALDLQPNNRSLYLQLCQALARQNEFDEAVIFFQMGLQAQPEKADIASEFNLLEIGDDCLQKGKLQEAIFFYQQGLYYHPDNTLLAWQLQNAIALKNREFAYPIETIKKLRLEDPKAFSLPTSESPIVSIIIPVYNQILHTYNCLRSLLDIDSEAIPFEVIVVDDHSSDNTQEVLAGISGIHGVVNSENLGFIGSCQRGASLAKGEYLFFLNNDTVVLPNCIQELLNTFKVFPNTGLVGSKLLYPNGQLQEAGGMIWQDGSGWNYGRLDHPNKPEYCYLREVDYCSGAGIMITKALWEKIGGFDSRYKPAYYEDTDLAFEVRKAGYKVYYQPLAQIVHFEGISSGTDVTQGIKKYQVINHQKFAEKWKTALKSHRPNSLEPNLERERNVNQRLLMIDACMLTPDQDSGSQTAFNLIKIFQSLGYKVTFAPDNLLYVEQYTSDLQRIGVECLYCSHVSSIASYLENYGPLYDVVYIARLECAEKYIDEVRKSAPQAKIIYDTVDLHYLREVREAKLKNNLELYENALITKSKELGLMEKADCTLVVSQAEKKLLETENPQLKTIQFFPMPRDIYGAERGFDCRKNILFIGGFQHTPNVDAVLYFVQEIFPLVKGQVKDMKFIIIGSNAPSLVLELASEDVIITGHVPDISDYFNTCKLSIAPLRYGAGIKGKILTSFSYGLPVVATSIAAEGMGIQDGHDVLVADSVNDFAQKIVALYNNQKLWNHISQNSVQTMNERYSMVAVTERFKTLFNSLGVSVSEV
jgi:GT2 family glycosyltransferase/cytochrome c-type biogenesis protein CcmH/NrfG/glycosyltransferase involved in cell wall biosynthesis